MLPPITKFQCDCCLLITKMRLIPTPFYAVCTYRCSGDTVLADVGKTIAFCKSRRCEKNLSDSKLGVSEFEFLQEENHFCRNSVLEIAKRS
jgi:hypothetical protein